MKNISTDPSYLTNTRFQTSLLCLTSSWTSPINLERPSTISGKSCEWAWCKYTCCHVHTDIKILQEQHITFVIGWYKPFLMENHSCVPVWHKNSTVGHQSSSHAHPHSDTCSLLTSMASLTSSRRSNSAGFIFWNALVLQIWTKILKWMCRNSNLMTLLGSLQTPSVIVPEQCVQLWSCSRRWGENISVFGHQTETILQETMKRITKFLLLFTERICSSVISRTIFQVKYWSNVSVF